MDLNLIFFNGYGLFVWPAFAITFVSCFVLFINTKKELKKQEKLYLNVFKEPTAELKATRSKPIPKEVLSASSVL